MSQVPVKWVPKGMVFEQCPDANPVDMLPVVPLSALREVVEEANELIRLLGIAYPWVGSGSGCRLQLGDSIKKTKHLLASLGEV